MRIYLVNSNHSVGKKTCTTNSLVLHGSEVAEVSIVDVEVEVLLVLVERHDLFLWVWVQEGKDVTSNTFCVIPLLVFTSPHTLKLHLQCMQQIECNTGYEEID